MKIFADQNIPCVEEAFSSIGEVQLFDGRTVQNPQLHETDILLVRSVTRVNQQLLENTPVRFVASATIGTDHIDFDYLAQHSISFANAPASNAISAAEYTLCAILYFSKLREFALSELSVAIVGYGNVGSRVKQRLDAIGVSSIVYDPPRAAQFSDIAYCDWQEVKQCNVITAHVPLTRSGPYPTLSMFNRDFFESLAPNTLFINTARGPAVDEHALLDVLNHKQLNLMLDVWQNEPLINTELQQRTLISTPHIAGYSYDGKLRGTEMIYDACCKYLGIAPQWRAEDILSDEATILLNYHPQSGTALWELVNQAYSIEQDNFRLAKTMSLDEAERGKQFDLQRKHYPKRREFSAFKVKSNGASQAESAVLQDLGFQLV